MSFLNFHWLLEWEAVTNERSGSCGDALLRYSSSRGGHWPLTWVGSLSGMLNFYWSSAHPGSWGRPGGLLNYDWLRGQPFFSSFSGTSWALAGWKELLATLSRRRTKGYQWIPWLGGVEWVARGHESNSCSFHTRVG